MWDEFDVNSMIAPKELIIHKNLPQKFLKTQYFQVLLRKSEKKIKQTHNSQFRLIRSALKKCTKTSKTEVLQMPSANKVLKPRSTRFSGTY